MTGPEAAALFRAIADRVEMTAGAFGGAFIVVPPGDAPEVIDGVTIATTPNPVVFWTSVEGQVGLAISQLRQAAERPGWGGRR